MNLAAISYYDSILDIKAIPYIIAYNGIEERDYTEHEENRIQ